MLRHMQDSVTSDFQNHYQFYDFVNDAVTRLMLRECADFNENIDSIYKTQILKVSQNNLKWSTKYRKPKKTPIAVRLKYTSVKGFFELKSPVIDLILKLPTQGKYKEVSLSKIGGNERGYSIDFLTENSMFVIKPEYCDVMITHVARINAINELSLFVRKIIVGFNQTSDLFIAGGFAFEKASAKQSQLKKLFKLNITGVFEYLTGEIFMHQKYYAEELFELIKTIKSDFESDTKNLIDLENKKLKLISEKSHSHKYYPVLNPIRITIQKGPMFIIRLPAADGHLNNMFTSIRIKSNQNLTSVLKDFDSKELYIKAKRDVYATHNLAKVDLAGGLKGLVPEMVLYNRFKPVPECLFSCVKQMMTRLDLINSIKVVVFEQQDELAILAKRLVNQKSFKSVL
tara:strand:+ start:12736 stop:13935 length:1200 start_codon:yes stop_codon:yes gene_type:complete